MQRKGVLITRKIITVDQKSHAESKAIGNKRKEVGGWVEVDDEQVEVTVCS